MKPAFELFGYRMPTYGIMMLLALLSAFFVLWRLVRRRGVRIECAITVTACAFGFALVGGYVTYMLASVGIPAILAAAREGRLFEVLSRGGIVFYGGLIGGIFGAWLGARLVELRFVAIMDLCAPALALAHAFGRVGCLFAGCCYGMPCELFFCFPLSSDIAGGARLFPVQLFEAGCDLALFLALLKYLKRPRPVPRAAGIYLMSYSAYRFILEFFRYDAIRGQVFGMSTSQFLGIPVFLLGAVFCFALAPRGIDPDPFRTEMGMIPGFRRGER
ncbi:MAG: prolipoprotein diacylglyceryl transferase [Clostridiales bacterium]|nr:prolipoprotein diacylglyceryl transferase [Clostridiales bacterium]